MTSERFRLEPALGLYCNYITFAAPGACFDVYSVRKAPQAHDILNALCDLKARPGGPKKLSACKAKQAQQKGHTRKIRQQITVRAISRKRRHNDARDG